VATCFLFTHQWDDEHFLCLRLDQQGHVEAPLALRPMLDVRALQAHARTIIVLPTERCSLHELELPFLSERKARSAIPFALEEQLSQHVTTLHFAVEKKKNHSGRYFVAVIDRSFLLDVIAQLEASHLYFDVMTLDWFALKENEVCLTADGLLVHDDPFKGGVSGELVAIYWNSPGKKPPCFRFQDSLSNLDPGTHSSDRKFGADCFSSEQISAMTMVDSPMLVWVAKRLLSKPALNLCQGELHHGVRKHHLRYGYPVAAGMAVVMLVSALVFKGLYWRALHVKNIDMDQKIAVMYREFFPNAKQIIQPQFRITQLLKEGGLNSDAAFLWKLLDEFATAFDDHQLMVEQFRFQNRVLLVTLFSKDFAALETLQQRLKQAHVKVTQSQASSHENKVMATLELRL
jgi:general secretion pathway protein L